MPRILRQRPSERSRKNALVTVYKLPPSSVLLLRFLTIGIPAALVLLGHRGFAECRLVPALVCISQNHRLFPPVFPLGPSADALFTADGQTLVQRSSIEQHQASFPRRVPNGNLNPNLLQPACVTEARNRIGRCGWYHRQRSTWIRRCFAQTALRSEFSQSLAFAGFLGSLFSLTQPKSH